MHKYFDEAYEAWSEAIENFKLFANLMCEVLVYFTAPFWIIPYAIIKKCKEKDNGKE